MTDKAKADGKKKLRAHKTGAPRKRVIRGRVGRAALAAGLVTVGLGAAGGGWWAWKHRVLPRAATEAERWIVAKSADMGFRIDEIFVTGRSQSTREDLLAALKLNRGGPMFGFDPETARKRVERLPWVRRAVVERMLPGTVLLHIEERRPLALWQNKGRFTLIDDTGEIILRRGLERFSDLPLVVGADAPVHAKALLETLKAEPELMQRVRAAVRVSGRRWNLRLENGVSVHLPEADPREAWQRLGDYERRHKVLERDVEVLDLRLPDRLIVRKAPQPKARRKPRGQET